MLHSRRPVGSDANLDLMQRFAEQIMGAFRPWNVSICDALDEANTSLTSAFEYDHDPAFSRSCVEKSQEILFAARREVAKKGGRHYEEALRYLESGEKRLEETLTGLADKTVSGIRVKTLFAQISRAMENQVSIEDMLHRVSEARNTAMNINPQQLMLSPSGI